VNDGTRDQSSSSLAHPEQGWQPIESAPHGIVVLVHDDGYVGKAMLQDGEWIDVEQGEAIIDPPPTHWLALPSPPPASQKEEQ